MDPGTTGEGTPRVAMMSFYCTAPSETQLGGSPSARPSPFELLVLRGNAADQNEDGVGN